jgi:hypothetical protein
MAGRPVETQLARVGISAQVLEEDEETGVWQAIGCVLGIDNRQHQSACCRQEYRRHGGGNFTMLVAALKAAGLVNTLQGPCLFTVFAPTDAAFSKLPAGTSANLLSPKNKAQLIQILLLSRGAGQGELTSADEAKGSQGVSRQILPVKLNGGPVSVMAPKSPLRTSQHATASFTSSTP